MPMENIGAIPGNQITYLGDYLRINISKCHLKHSLGGHFARMI